MTIPYFLSDLSPSLTVGYLEETKHVINEPPKYAKECKLIMNY